MITPPDLQTVIERGLQAKELIRSPAFTAVVDDLTNYHLAALVAAPPGKHGEDAREYHHLLQHALTEIVKQLSAYAEAGDAALKALEGADDEEDNL